jgi:hypothetical protein
MNSPSIGGSPQSSLAASTVLVVVLHDPHIAAALLDSLQAAALAPFSSHAFLRLHASTASNLGRDHHIATQRIASSAPRSRVGCRRAGRGGLLGAAASWEQGRESGLRRGPWSSADRRTPRQASVAESAGCYRRESAVKSHHQRGSARAEAQSGRRPTGFSRRDIRHGAGDGGPCGVARDGVRRRSIVVESRGYPSSRGSLLFESQPGWRFNIKGCRRRRSTPQCYSLLRNSQ